jgi:hypothetical protein
MIVGGTMIGSISAVLTGQGPFRTMQNLAQDLKIWAAVAAIGGTFTSLQALESGLLEGQVSTVAKQLAFLFSAFAGAHLGYMLVLTVAGGKR